MRRLRFMLLASVALLSAALLAGSLGATASAARGRAALVTRPLFASPLTDAAAARKVRRSSWEPRPENRATNRRMPTRAELDYFYANSDMPYRHRVTGRFRGTTDEIIQWAAHKWGFAPDLFRAVATVESWWKMSTLGDGGDSLGLMQHRRPYHCCHPLAGQSTAFNLDYYGGILRAFYEGRMPWLNQVPRGRDYRPGDLWGSVGVWASGRWYLGSSAWYVGMVQQRMRERTWFDRWF
jgi:hypothetical protein